MLWPPRASEFRCLARGWYSMAIATVVVEAALYGVLAEEIKPARYASDGSSVICASLSDRPSAG